MNPNIHIVTKEEYHAIKICPCEECIKERKRRKKNPLPKSHLSLPVYTARLFGYIPSLQSQGSLARKLMDSELSQYPNL